MAVTTNYGWPLPEDREQFLEIFLRERLIDVDADLSRGPNNSPSARVYHNANQSISSVGVTALAFNSERFDNDTIHSTSTNNTRLTCKTAGKYLIGGSVEWASNATGFRQLLIRVNGSFYVDVGTVNPISGDTTKQGVKTLYQLAVNDYVELLVFQTSGGSLNVNSVGAYSPEFWMVKAG
jgi:hypothetical protein